MLQNTEWYCIQEEKKANMTHKWNVKCCRFNNEVIKTKILSCAILEKQTNFLFLKIEMEEWYC